MLFFQKIILILSIVITTFGSTFAIGINVSASGSDLPLVIEKQPTELEKIYTERKEKIEELVDEEEESQNVHSIGDAIKDIEIKADLNTELHSDFTKQVESLESEILKNHELIDQLQSTKQQGIDDRLEIEKLETLNNNYKKQISYKQLVIFDLEKTIESLRVLKTKYDNILAKYVDIKKDKDLEKKEEFNNKLKILYAVLILSLFLYILRYLLSKKYLNKYESNFVYFDLIHGISLILFLIGFFFYIFPQLYILLIFISGSLIFVNASLISSFISSLIVFRRYKIGDVIKHDNKIGKIKKITPLFTNIRILNKYGVISTDIESIPNILLIKDKVMVIQEPTLIDHEFSIALSLKDSGNIFKIIEGITENILLKNLNQRIANINFEDETIFKVFHTQDDPNFIMVNFTWRASPNRSRKIEAKIISYVQNYINQYKINIENTEDK